MFWTVVEAGRATENGIGGGQADAMLVDRSGKTVAAGHADIDPGAVSVRVSLTSSSEFAAGEYELRVRVKGTGSATASTESMSILS